MLLQKLHDLEIPDSRHTSSTSRQPASAARGALTSETPSCLLCGEAILSSWAGLQEEDDDDTKEMASRCCDDCHRDGGGFRQKLANLMAKFEQRYLSST